MKKIFLFLAVAVMALQGCDGPEGPAGPTGYSAEAQVYETIPIDFLTPSFGVFYTFPQAILASDHVLVYRLSAIDNGADVWRLLPQSFYFADGTFDFGYNYDFTQFDVNLFIEGNDLSTLGTQFTQDQIFRIVVVPGYFARSSVEVNDYNAVIQSLGVEGKAIKPIQ